MWGCVRYLSLIPALPAVDNHQLSFRVEEQHRQGSKSSYWQTAPTVRATYKKARPEIYIFILPSDNFSFGPSTEL